MLQAKEFGEAEVWMNERLMRVAPSSFAKFVTAFEERTGPEDSRDNKLLWLVRRCCIQHWVCLCDVRHRICICLVVPAMLHAGLARPASCAC